MIGRDVAENAIGITLRGVQRFWCRGAMHDSTPGDVIVIHPGEVHDGQSGSAGGYVYRMFYVSRQLIETSRSKMTSMAMASWRLPVRCSQILISRNVWIRPGEQQRWRPTRSPLTNCC